MSLRVAVDAEADPPTATRGLSPLVSLRILVLSCVVLPLLAYAVFGAARYRQIRAETEVRLDRALRIAEEHALKIFDTNETVLARVVDALGDDDEPGIVARGQALHRQFARMAANRPQIASIWVTGVDGRPLVTDVVHPPPSAPASATASPPDAAASRAAASARAGRAGVGRDLRFSTLRGADDGAAGHVEMSVEHRLADGRVAAIASIRFLPSQFERFYRDLAADEPGLAITMLRDDGAIYTRWPPLPNAPDRLSPSSPVMSRIQAGDKEGKAHGVSSVDGRERLLTFSRVGDHPVYLGTGMDVGEIVNRWREEMVTLVVLGLPPMVGLALAAGVALRRTRQSLETAARLQQETRARQRIERALLQTQKLEALGRLTGGVAHDFNNALMVISNNLYLMKRLQPDADNPQVESIRRAVASATQLTRQLLAFSRHQPLVVEPIDLARWLPGLAALLGPVLGARTTVSIEVEPGVAPIMADPAELELALLNLAINARDAMPDGGRFVVAARSMAGEPGDASGAPRVVIEASDTGAGIDPAVLDRVFEPFFTTKPTGEGTGLGLSQVDALCERAGGAATIRSEPGRGTTVAMSFPALLDAAPIEPATPAAAPLRIGRTLVLVEDNAEVAAALLPVLRELGCEVTAFDRATAAWAWLRQGGTPPDVLLSDVVMPGELDGLALADRVRAAHPGVGIVLMTGYAKNLALIASRGFEIVPKPCSAELLAAAIERVTRARDRSPD